MQMSQLKSLCDLLMIDVNIQSSTLEFCYVPNFKSRQRKRTQTGVTTDKYK